MDDVVIVAAARTAVGTFNGQFATTPAHVLGAAAIRAAIERASVAPDEVAEVILGQVLTAGAGQNPARRAAVAAGLPHATTAWGVNQLCGSGLRAVALGAQQIACGDAAIVVAGGQENMTLAPHAVELRAGRRMGDVALVDTLLRDGLQDAFEDIHMGVTAETVARRWNIGRAEQDNFALGSQQRAAAAMRDGCFADEIVPVRISTRTGEIAVATDEHPRPDVTADQLARLKPVFAADGTVTAGNASGINDGAAAVVLMRATEARRRGLAPFARIASAATAGVDPAIMGTGPIPASRAALLRAGWSADTLELVECNEAFAAQACAVNREMGWDPAIVNVHGGAIALGHPIGASGARVLVTLLHAMARRRARRALATLCIGGGMGIAMALEAC